MTTPYATVVFATVILWLVSASIPIPPSHPVRTFNMGVLTGATLMFLHSIA